MNIRMATLPQMLRDHARRSPQRLSQRHKTRGIWREYDFSQVQRCMWHKVCRNKQTPSHPLMTGLMNWLRALPRASKATR